MRTGARRSVLATRRTDGTYCCTAREAAARRSCSCRAGVAGPGFLNIHDQVSAVTTSVLYDRAVEGWSEDV